MIRLHDDITSRLHSLLRLSVSLMRGHLTLQHCKSCIGANKVVLDFLHCEPMAQHTRNAELIFVRR